MIGKDELQTRVDARRQELTAQADRLTAFRDKLADFISDIRSRSAVYALVKNLKLWKELEELITDNGEGS